MKSRGIGNPRGLVSPSKATGVDRIPRRAQEGGSRVLVWYQESDPAVFQEFRGTIPGNSQLGVVGDQFPRRRQRRSWRPGITPDTGVGVVLEAWCYTRAAGTEVIHVAATGFQGIPDCIARYNSPRMWRRLAQYQRLLGASISKGAVINSRVAWVTAATGMLVYWYTGILVYWYSKYTGGHNFHFVYTLVTVLICL